MKWIWQVAFYVGGALFIFYLTSIIDFVKYNIFWHFSKEKVKFTLQPIWEKAGIIEIQGGAESGKTLLIILLTSYLDGRKWSNVPNIIPGWKRLTLNTIKKHYLGEFEEGIVGVNNLLLIDESWNFFSQHELNRVQLTHSLNSLMFFLSETSKTGWKIFYVSKQGAELPKAFNLLSDNKSASIRTLGTRKYCRWWGKQYYYLDIELITPQDQEKTPNPTKKNKKGKPYVSWWTRLGLNFFGQNQGIISIPFSQEDLKIFDRTWNLEGSYARNRMKSIIDTLAADGLIEGLKYKQSRVQRLQEEDEALAWVKKHPDANMKKNLHFKALETMKKRGIWKSAEERISEETTQLQKDLDNNQITLESYKKKMEEIDERKTKLAMKMSHEQKLADPKTDSDEDSFKEVAVEDGEEKEEKIFKKKPKKKKN